MKIKDGIVGFLVADALGVPVEFTPRDILKESPVTTMMEYGTYNQPAGTYSDDTSLTLATMDGLTQSIYTIDYERIMESFVRWYKYGEYSQYSEAFDIGNATRAAINEYIHGTDALKCGQDGERDNGNGSLMRILPIAYYINELYHNEEKEIIYEFVENLSSLTHSHDISKIACVLYVELVLSILNNEKSFEKHLDYAIEYINKYYKENYFLERFERILSKNLLTLPESEISSTGFVLSTLEAVIWCIYNSNNYKDAVLKAVNLGNDTDTVGAICGSIAGLIYGYDDIPKEWINTIVDLDYVLDLCDDFEIAIYNQQITNLCQFKDYFKNADEDNYEIIPGTIDEPYGHVKYDDEIYIFEMILIRNNYICKESKEYLEENVSSYTTYDIKKILSNIMNHEQSCKNSYRKAIKNKKFYNLLSRLDQLRR